VAVDRHRQHVVALVEDVLLAVAVVVVDVQDRHLAVVRQEVGGDGGVVEVAEAAEAAALGVVARRAHQGIGQGRAVQHLLGGGERAVDGAAGGRPGVAVQRREGVDAPVAGAQPSAPSAALGIADREDVGIDRPLQRRFRQARWR
jgi:hypothetical protein